MNLSSSLGQAETGVCSTLRCMQISALKVWFGSAFFALARFGSKAKAHPKWFFSRAISRKRRFYATLTED
jgi:hypothetical protein